MGKKATKFIFNLGKTRLIAALLAFLLLSATNAQVVSPGAYPKYDFHREKGVPVVPEVPKTKKLFRETKIGLFLKEMKPTKWDYATIGLLTIEAIANAGIDAVRKDPDVFERKFGVGDYDWGGSEDWQRNYVGNRYQNADGGANRHKSEVFGNFWRDFDHTAKDVRKWTARLGGAGFAVGFVIDIRSGEPVWPRLAKGALISGASSLIERAAYTALTK